MSYNHYLQSHLLSDVPHLCLFTGYPSQIPFKLIQNKTKEKRGRFRGTDKASQISFSRPLLHCWNGIMVNLNNLNRYYNIYRYIESVFLTLCGALSSLRMVPSCVARGIVVAKAKVGARTGMGKAVVADRGSLSSRYCTRKVISSSGSIFTIILTRKHRRLPCDCIRSFRFDLQFFK